MNTGTTITVTAAANSLPQASPFRLDDDTAYRAWREQKLDQYPVSAEQLLVPVRDPARPGTAETTAMLSILGKTNMVIYRGQDITRQNKDIPRQLGAHFGLQQLDPNMLADDDGITSLQVVEGKSLRGYIPYSNRRLLWHTDGYYNPPQRQIRAFILHCVRPALEGGENSLMDHELVYIRLRDENPDFIRALMQPDAMTIPANEESPEQARKAQSGPVFSVDPGSGSLHMRYTARTRSIQWAQDATTGAARAALEDILQQQQGLFRYRLQAGEGLLCNNVLHSRTAFTNGKNEEEQRLVYRARYYDRIRQTGATSNHINGEASC
jgi:alpha-ketoglutarate-dependent taurine dioxygenase